MMVICQGVPLRAGFLAQLTISCINAHTSSCPGEMYEEVDESDPSLSSMAIVQLVFFREFEGSKASLPVAPYE